jgi:5-methyltetrahydrofolate--homocysteine methyltransferase
MIIIGERINATRKSIAAALEARNAKVIVKEAKDQAAAGAGYLDVNGGDPREGREAENIAWLMDVIQANTDSPVAVDSANPQAVRVGLSKARKRPILNSISLEENRLAPLLPMLKEFDCMVIGLLMSDEGAPRGVDDRLKIAAAIIEKCTAAGRKLDQIIIDPCFLTISTDSTNGRRVIDAIAAIRKEWPEVHIGGGCSNISFGLPKRRFVNLALLAAAIYHGMDAGLVDPCQPDVMAIIRAAEALAGKDEFCMNYVRAERERRLR